MILLKNHKNILRVQGGSSSSIIFPTYDGNFMIKTITKSEKKKFLTILHKYSQRIINTPQSKLIRIIGLYKILPENQDFLIMENIIPEENESIIFDLKGSSIDRLIDSVDHINLPLGKILKDENFRKSQLKVELSENIVKEIITILQQDFELLKSENIMDYSILLAFYTKKIPRQNRYQIEYNNKLYALGIIDILQEYNFAKITEEKWKSLYIKNKSRLSVAEPESYYSRICEYIEVLFKKI